MPIVYIKKCSSSAKDTNDSFKSFAVKNTDINICIKDTRTYVTRVYSYPGISEGEENT